MLARTVLYTHARDNDFFQCSCNFQSNSTEQVCSAARIQLTAARQVHKYLALLTDNDQKAGLVVVNNFSVLYRLSSPVQSSSLDYLIMSTKVVLAVY